VERDSDKLSKRPGLETGSDPEEPPSRGEPASGELSLSPALSPAELSGGPGAEKFRFTTNFERLSPLSNGLLECPTEDAPNLGAQSSFINPDMTGKQSDNTKKG